MLCPILIVALVATPTAWAQPNQLAPVGSSIDSFGSPVLETYDDSAQVSSTEAKFPRISKSNWGSRRDDDYNQAINAIEEMNNMKTPDYRWGSAQAVSQDENADNNSESFVDLEKRRGGGGGGGGGHGHGGGGGGGGRGGGGGGGGGRKKSDGNYGAPIPGFYQYLNPNYWRSGPENQ
ncbi:hypothetical protein IWQ60_004421 [Tieghemiomyces parasiticus]|uniref:Uncharacterized protein n=1 Tax=Tieghemiomyces parasiticus TaxID=78921 RepID=A0A9W8A881_9FUNG|nr:hypothetical protein IWQ60_004421 [Tieghemiomyces parasiticus]